MSFHKNGLSEYMKLGMIGLGRMGFNMTTRLLRGGHKVVGYARHAETVDQIVEKGAIGAYSLEELVHNLPSPRVVWLMIPAGDPVDKTIQALLPQLISSDCSVKDSVGLVFQKIVFCS